MRTSQLIGVQLLQIQDLLLTNKKSIRPTAWEVNPRSVIFVVNKWDEVPDEVKEEKKRDIFQAIRRSWNGFDESQIIYMSINEARYFPGAMLSHQTSVFDSPNVGLMLV